MRHTSARRTSAQLAWTLAPHRDSTTPRPCALSVSPPECPTHESQSPDTCCFWCCLLWLRRNCCCCPDSPVQTQQPAAAHQIAAHCSPGRLRPRSSAGSRRPPQRSAACLQQMVHHISPTHDEAALDGSTARIRACLAAMESLRKITVPDRWSTCLQPPPVQQIGKIRTRIGGCRPALVLQGACRSGGSISHP